ncbi:MAG: RluA family pseudouridine synthase [Pseudomonadota bacterium]
MSGVQTITVEMGEGDQRLDRWLKRRFPELTQGRIEKGCRKGEFRIDGARAKPASRVAEGQAVRIPPIAEGQSVPPFKRTKMPPSQADVEMMQRAVLYRDAHLMAINKPPGLPSQGGSKQLRHVDGLSDALRFGGDKPKLVHRLDKDTSGVLLLARTAEAARALAAAFRARETRKIYWAAVAGTPKPEIGTIRYGLVKAGGDAEKMRTLHPDLVAETRDAKHATTDYATLSMLGTRAAWMALVPVTGRTHQLRAHIAAIGNPIIGDGKYGGSSQENLGDGWGAGMGGLSRKLHLHARSLRMTHPFTGAQLTLTAPLPDHMARTWQMFEWHPDDVPADPFEDMS